MACRLAWMLPVAAAVTHTRRTALRHTAYAVAATTNNSPAQASLSLDISSKPLQRREVVKASTPVAMRSRPSTAQPHRTTDLPRGRRRGRRALNALREGRVGLWESSVALDGASGDAGPGALTDEPTADAAPPLLSAPADDPSASGSVLSLLRQKKRKKRKAEEDAYEGEYVPLDPMDWRAKIA